MQRLGLRIGLTFAPGIKGTKRRVRVLVGGILTFGDRELPVPLFGRQRVDGPDLLASATGQTEELSFPAHGGVGTIPDETSPEMAPPGHFDSQREGISCTKLSRGDKI